MWNTTKMTLLQALRQRYVQVMGLLMVGLFVLVAINGTRVHKARVAGYENATKTMRQAWESIGAVNPHNSAHYGHIIFQPVTGMQVLDNGIRPYTGGMLRLEAHKQNEPVFSAAQQRTELSRFGDFSLAWVLQILLPLFLFLTTFQWVSSDRESQTLRMMAAQRLPPLQYLAGKALAAILIGLSMLAIGITTQYVVFYTAGAGTPIPLGHLGVWLGAFSMYIIALSLLSVGISSIIKNSTASLTLLLTIWVLWMIVMPPMTANMGAAQYPMEHRQAFNTALAEDRKKGIDGHNPADERIKKFEDSLLAHYKVSSMDSLPVNADGLIMQADEYYANMVYDKHFTRIRNTLLNQNSISRTASIANPYLAVRNLSMGLTQSDMYHHMQLLEDAEQYRRVLIQTLNEKMAYGGSKTGDWNWAPDSTWYTSIPDFAYQSPALTRTVSWYGTEWFALFLWIITGATTLWVVSKKLYRIA
jgi:ABC-2 type transport system permease protein